MKNHLNQSIFDWENSPDNHFIFNPYLRTILNKDNAIQIGDTIYVLVNNGWYKFIDKSLYLFVVNAIVTGTDPSPPGAGVFGEIFKPDPDPTKACGYNIEKSHNKKVGKRLMISQYGFNYLPAIGTIVGPKRGHIKR